MTLVFGEGDPVVAGDDDDIGERQRPARVPELAGTAVASLAATQQNPSPAATRRLT